MILEFGLAATIGALIAWLMTVIYSKRRRVPGLHPDRPIEFSEISIPAQKLDITLEDLNAHETTVPYDYSDDELLDALGELGDRARARRRVKRP